MTAISDDLISRLRQSISTGVDFKPRQVNVGTVDSVGDGVARIVGLDQVRASELIEFPPKAGRSDSVFGIALNLERDVVGAVILGDYLSIEEGDQASATGEIISVPVGQELLGRVVNSLAQPIDGKGSINTSARRPIERSRANARQRLQQAVLVVRLEQIIDRAQLERPDGVLVERRHENQQRRGGLLELGGDLEARQAGHLDVEKYDIGLRSSDRLRRIESIRALRRHF